MDVNPTASNIIEITGTCARAGAAGTGTGWTGKGTGGTITILVYKPQDTMVPSFQCSNNSRIVVTSIRKFCFARAYHNHW
jgi:hypothetical protein